MKQTSAAQTVKQPKQIKLTTVILISFVVALGGFVVGTRTQGFLLWLGSENKNLSGTLDFSSLQQTYNLMRDKYDGKLDPNALIQGAQKGMVAAAGDPYTVYFTADDAKQFSNDLEGKFSGIGAEIGSKDGKLVISSTIDSSPAQKAGLQSGDVIEKVNDQDATSWTIDQAVDKIRGDKGTTVKLTVLRSTDVKDFSIVRDDIVNPSVTSSITSDNIGILRISRFDQGDTTTLAQQAAQNFKAKGVKGVIVDLRGNGGGYLNDAQAVASLWLDNKVVVQEKRGSQVVDTLRSDSNPILGGIPTIVLVDGGSASASEILAGALHDNGAAKLVGVKTFGKGSVQEIETLPGGAELKVTVAKWYTPDGKNINKEGIQPDVNVPLTDADAKAGNDPQKDKAIQLLTQQ